MWVNKRDNLEPSRFMPVAAQSAVDAQKGAMELSGMAIELEKLVARFKV